jgi:exosortase J
VLTAATYNNGVAQKLEASTVCDGGTCRQFSQDYDSSGRHITLIYARPHRGIPLQPDATRPVPVLLKVESSDTVSPLSAVRPQLESGLTQFLQQADLVHLAAPYARR